MNVLQLSYSKIAIIFAYCFFGWSFFASALIGYCFGSLFLEPFLKRKVRSFTIEKKLKGFSFFNDIFSNSGFRDYSCTYTVANGDYRVYRVIPSKYLSSLHRLVPEI